MRHHCTRGSRPRHEKTPAPHRGPNPGCGPARRGARWPANDASTRPSIWVTDVFPPGAACASATISKIVQERARTCRLGVSQVQVSRLLRRTLRKVQDKIDPDVVMSKPKRGPCCEQVARPVFSDYWVEAIARANWRVMWVCGSAPSIGTCKRRPASCEGCGPAALRCLSACAHVAPEPMWRLGA